MLTFVAVTAVVICSWILILAFLVDVSRSQENDKLEDVLQEDALPVDEERPPRDTDAASSKRTSIYYVLIFVLFCLNGHLPKGRKWVSH